MNRPHQRQTQGAFRGRVFLDLPAEQERQSGADIDSGGVDADGNRHSPRRNIVGDQRVGSWRERSFAHAYAHAQHQHLGKRRRDPASRGEEAPQNQADGNDRPTAIDID